MSRMTVAVAWIALQFVYLCGWTLYEASRLLPGAGESVLVRTEPVDPRDLLRGQYMRLRYPFNRTDGSFNAESNETVWVVLRPETRNGQTFYEPVQYSRSRPTETQPQDVVIRGTAEGGGRLDFGIGRYFVPEGTETPSASEITVRLRVGSDHRPRIETVYKNGQPWP